MLCSCTHCGRSTVRLRDGFSNRDPQMPWTSASVWHSFRRSSTSKGCCEFDHKRIKAHQALGFELQVFVGYIRHTSILLPKERFMKWGHHHLKSPKVNGPSWISTLWLKKGNSHIPTISPKIVPNMFEFVNRVRFCFNAPREFLLECRECLPECRVFLPDFFCKKDA